MQLKRVALTQGLYFKPRIAYGDWGRLWKIDIWSLELAQIEAGRKEMQRLKALITTKKREIILKYKVSRLNTQGRTPQGSGWWIYQTVLEEGLREETEMDAFLTAHGIRVGGNI